MRGNIRAGLLASIIFGFGIALSAPTNAVLVNPTSPAPGGLTALPLSTSTLTQYKLGSLVLGYAGSAQPAKICLGATSATDATNCISSWSQVGTMATSQFVTLHTNTPGTILDSYDPAQLGYAHIRGTNAATAATTFSTAVDSTLNGGTALYADGLDLDNYAGYFVGKLTIQKDSFNNDGKLCLNGTTFGSNPTGHYCIAHWSDIPTSTLTDKLALQNPSNAPSPQSGNVGLAQALQSGSVVLGDSSVLPAGLIGYACGDGMCTTGETSSCLLDCATINPLTSFTAVDSGLGTVSLTFTTAAQTPSGQVYVLIVRSSNSSFTFTPVNGVQYGLGGTEALTVVSSQLRNQGTTFNLDDADVVVGRTYTYRAYQANAYPRFTPMSGSTAYRTATATPTDGGSNGGGDQPPAGEEDPGVKLPK